MDRPHGLGADLAALINWIADDIDDAAEHFLPHGHRDAAAGIDGFLAAHEPIRRVHGDAADRALAQVLRHLQNQAVALIVDVKGVQNRRKLALEVHVHDRAQDLGDLPDHISRRHLALLPLELVRIAVRALPRRR